MTTTLSLDPVTRIEGHLAVHADIKPVGKGQGGGHQVTRARCEGEMFRGFEKILEGRDPLDAQQITQRICGVCPISHGIASVRAQEMAYGIVPTRNGRLMQNLIFTANFLQSHVMHFYHLAALDFVDVKAVLQYSGNSELLLRLKAWIEKALASGQAFPAAPFLPRFDAHYAEDLDVNTRLLSHYVEALDVRRLCHEMGAVFGARLPHSTALFPGGCSQAAAVERILSYSARLKKVFAFIRDTYIPDVLSVADQFPEYYDLGRGCTNFLCHGVFWMDDQGNKFIKPGTVIDGKWEPFDEAAIAEDVGYSWFSSPSGLHPTKGKTVPDPKKEKAYSWIKAPRYRGHAMEVGPLARMMVNYHDPNSTWVKKDVDRFLARTNLSVDKLSSVMGRHVARALESLWIAQQARKWIDEIEIDEPTIQEYEIPNKATGFGLTEAPRGALGHWLAIDNHRITHYQCVVPTTWNCSPRDDREQPGPVEQALEGSHVDNPSQPMEVARIVRSFDPCLACAVH